MKPFLGIDITENKKNEKYNGDEFIAATPSAVQAQALDNASDAMTGVLEKTKIPLVLRVCRDIFTFAALIGIASLIRIIFEDDAPSIAEVYEALPWLIWIIVLCGIAGTALLWFTNKKYKDVLASEESKNAEANLDTVAANIYAELGVPANSTEAELLSVSYKIKNGEISLKKEDFAIKADNLNYKIFLQEDRLCIADCEQKYAFPLSELKNIKTVEKRLTIPVWCKDEDYNKGVYKQYKLQEGKYGDIAMKYFHILELEHNGESWGIYFPCYELPVIEGLTGLKAE